MRAAPFVVALVAVGVLYFLGLGQTPFLDPPEGFQTAIARAMADGGDWVTPRINGVRYFDKPPLLHWLMAATFRVVAPGEAAARFWPAAAALGVVAATMRLGVILANPRVGLLAGLFTATNLGIFLYARLVKTDLLFILCLTLAWLGLAAAYVRGRRAGLALFWAGLGLAAMAKDVLGFLGPVAAVAAFAWLTRERAVARWAPWWGPALFLGIAVPWYVAVERANPGFLWYTLVDVHLLTFTRHRLFPGEDVPLGSLAFLVVTLAAFLPWTLTLPAALARTLRRPWPDAAARFWVLIGLWGVLVVGFFTLSPFKLPHYGLPAFPALALLVARVWDERLAGGRETPQPAALLTPLLVLFAAVGLAFALAAADLLPTPTGALTSVDLTTRNVVARGRTPVQAPLEAYAPTLVRCAVVFGVATLALGVALWRRAVGGGLGVALAAMLAFLPLAGDGMAQFGRSRSMRTVSEALLREVAGGGEVAVEGPLATNGSLLLALGRPVRVVNGLRSNLAFGATFPEARDVFWDGARLRVEWLRRERMLLVTSIEPDRSVVRTLPAASVRLVARAGGRYLYARVPGR